MSIVPIPPRRGSSESGEFVSIPTRMQSVPDIQNVLSIYNQQAAVAGLPTVPAFRSSQSSQQIADTSWFLPSFLRSLQHYDYQHDFDDVASNILPETCEWTLDTAEVRWWAQDHSPRLLWFTGDPGIGKSSLACSLVRQLRHPPQEFADPRRSKVLYSFCHYQNNNTPSKIISVLLHQLCSSYPQELMEVAYQDIAWSSLDKPYAIQKAKHRRPNVLFSLLEKMIHHLAGKDKIFVIIDGIDVLERDAQTTLMGLFSKPFGERSTPAQAVLKLLFLSRQGDAIERMQSLWLMNFPDSFRSMESSQFQRPMDEDLSDFISRHMKRLRGPRTFAHSPEDLDNLEKHLKQSKSFLLASLYLKHFESRTSRPLVSRTMQDGVSHDLANFYHGVFAGLPPFASSITPSPMMFVTCSFQPLSLNDLAVVSQCLDPEWSDQNPAETLKLGLEVAKRNLVNRVKQASPILKVSDDGFVTFFHDSVRDFLTSSEQPGSNFGVKPSEAHTLLAIACMRNIVLKSAVSIPEWRAIAKKERAALLKEPFLAYSAQFWYTHLLEAVPHDTPTAQIDQQVLRTFQSLMGLWLGPTTKEYFSFVLSQVIEDRSDLMKMAPLQSLTPIEILSALGLNPFLRAYLERISSHVDLREMMPSAERAIVLAASGDHQGHLACFTTLLSTFQIESLQGEKFDSIIQKAIATTQPEILERVLELRTAGTDEFVTALLKTYLEGDLDSLQRLTKDRSIFKERNHFGMTALHVIFARTSGVGRRSSKDGDHFFFDRKLRRAVAMFLIRNGVRADAVDTFGYTALHWACSSRYFCHREIIELLVSEGADPSAVTPFGLTALHLAALHADTTDALKCLLEIGRTSLIKASVTRSSMTPLHWAVTRSRSAHPYRDSAVDVITLLLRHGGDLNRPNSRGITPLQWGGYKEERQEELQKIFTRLQGVHIIPIEFNTRSDLTQAGQVISHSIYWDALRDMGASTPREVVMPVSDGYFFSTREITTVGEEGSEANGEDSEDDEGGSEVSVEGSEEDEQEGRGATERCSFRRRAANKVRRIFRRGA